MPEADHPGETLVERKFSYETVDMTRFTRRFCGPMTPETGVLTSSLAHFMRRYIIYPYYYWYLYEPANIGDTDHV